MTETATRPVQPAVHDVGRKSRQRAGILFVALAAQFMTVSMLAAAMVPEYDFNGAAISDLGVAPETALLFNTALVVTGLLNVAGGLYCYRAHGKRWLAAVFVLAGVGAAGAGVFPLDTGAPHSLFALLAFVFFNVQALGTATWLRGPMRLFAALAGSIGLLFVVLMALGDAGVSSFAAFGHGGTERMIVYPVMLWLVAFGGYLLGTSGRPESSGIDSE